MAHDATYDVEITIHEVCDPAEPATDTWLYTDGLHDGLGPELAVASRPDPRHDPALLDETVRAKLTIAADGGDLPRNLEL